MGKHGIRPQKRTTLETEKDVSRMCGAAKRGEEDHQRGGNGIREA